MLRVRSNHTSSLSQTCCEIGATVNEISSSVGKVIRRWPTPEARRWVLSFLHDVAASDDTLSVVAVGSAIRPAVESDDLDLVVILRDGVSQHWRAPIEIDLRGYEISKVDHELASGSDLLTWTVKYGVALFDRGAVWKRIVEEWSDRLQLPDPKVAEKRAAAAHAQLVALEEVGDASAANEVRVSYLTHRARAVLSRSGTFPASRPELAGQLRAIGESQLAREIDLALEDRRRLASESTAV